MGQGYPSNSPCESGSSSVGPVVHVTGNFLTEKPLSPLVTQALLAAIEDGWADPKKIHQSSSKSRRLLAGAKESIGSALGVLPADLEFIGEPRLGYYLSIAGLMSSAQKLYYSEIDRQVVHAIARTFESEEISVDRAGRFLLPKIFDPDSLLHIQSANIETGITQNLALDGPAFIAIDATASGTRIALPEKWDCALFDSRSWGGPSGLGVLAISNSRRWKNPLPHISNARVPQSYFLPLAIASAVAIENFQEDQEKIDSYAQRIFEAFPDCAIGVNSEKLAHLISLTFKGIESQELARKLEIDGYLVDAGSACTSADLSASHVLDALGIESQGHIRITLHSDIAPSEVDGLINAIKKKI